MDYEEKFLDIDYLATRIRDFKEIRRGDFSFEIERSCNYPKSPSLYVKIRKGTLRVGELRVSDHMINAIGETQFIVERGAILSKKKKEQFVRIVEKVLKRAKKNALNSALRKL